METDSRKSVYRYGAEYGRYMGVYLILLSGCFIASPWCPYTLFLMALLLPAMPAILYRQLLSVYRQAPHNRTFSALWTAGIMTTLCGSLICALVTAAWLLYVQPDFFAAYLRAAIATVQQSGQSDLYASQLDMMRKALETGTAPSAMQFVVSMIWSTVFLGSIISMVCAWILMLRHRRSLSGTV